MNQSIACKIRQIARPTIAAIGALLLVLASPIQAATTQRMLLPPQSFTIVPGGTGDAESYCLDLYAEGPARDTRFQAAPATLGDISVSLPGKGTHSLQAAIENKLVEVVGNGGYETVTFRNLNGNSPITVSIKRNSVVVPPDNAATDDIADLPVFGSPGQPALDQDTIWRTRAEQAQQKLGQLPTAIATAGSAELFDLTHDGILAIRNWTKRNNGASAEKIFVLQRAHQFPFGNRGQPLYVLYKPNGQILTYEGNGNLGQIVNQIRQSPSEQRARVVLIGAGNDMDFDAARLTMETAAGGSGGKGPGTPSILNFQPPSGTQPPGGGRLYPGSAWDDLVIARSKQRFSATQPVFHRGTVTVYSKTEQLLGRMAAAVRRVTLNTPLAKAEKKELIDRLRASIRFQVALAIAEDPSLKDREVDTPAAKLVIDMSTLYLDSTALYQKFADLPPAVQSEALQRVASSTHEH